MFMEQQFFHSDARAHSRCFRAFCLLLLLLCGLPGGQTAFGADRWETCEDQTPASTPTASPPATGVKRAVATVQRAPLLTVQWRLLKFTDDGFAKWLASMKPSRRKIACSSPLKPTERTFTSPAADRRTRRPVTLSQPHYNAGRNYVRTDQEFVLPRTARISPSRVVQPAPPAGKEIVTLIFSRDEIEELPNFVSPSAAIPNVSSRVITQLLAGTQQRLQESPACCATGTRSG